MLNLLTTISFAAIAAAVGASPAPSPSSRPTNALLPIGVRVIVGPRVPPSLVARILDETDAIWRAAGVTFVWQRDGGLPTALRVTIGDEAATPLDGETTLGWIRFDARNVPEPEIHLSYANAVDLLEHSEPVVGRVSTMPPAERATLLGRAMGRALAHEMGHYLLATKAHTAKGLMQTRRSASDLFGIGRAHFQIDDGQRLAARAASQSPVAGRQSIATNPPPVDRQSPRR
jgi:hypothetical protein